MNASELPVVRKLCAEGAWPSFSPDGSTIVFTSGLTSGTRSLMTLPTASDGSTRPTPVTSADFAATRPTWSPDPTKIAYTRNAGAIYTLDLESRRSAPFLDSLPADAPSLFHPCWYPDAKSIAAVGFADGPAGREGVLYKLTPGGLTPLEPLTSFPEACAGRPSVGPDGRSVAFSGNAGRFDQERNQLWVVTPPAAARRLEPGEPASAYQGRAPAWSPDGQWIAFVSTRPSKRPTRTTPKAVWVIRSTGGDARRLTDSSYNPAQVAWSRDQRRIVFGSFSHGLGMIDVPARFLPVQPIR